MKPAPLWRREVTLRDCGGDPFASKGIFVYGTTDFCAALPPNIAAIVRKQPDPYQALSQLIEDMFIPTGSACLYFNPRTGTKQLLLTGAEIMCEDVSDRADICALAFNDECAGEIHPLCPNGWWELFRRLRDKGWISPESCDEIVAAK